MVLFLWELLTLEGEQSTAVTQSIDYLDLQVKFVRYLGTGLECHQDVSVSLSLPK